jgi:hypothetical protein
MKPQNQDQVLMTNPNWYVEIEAPDHGLTPWQMGAQDANEGDYCLPELFFTDHQLQIEYAQGYESIAGRTLLSDQVLGRKRQRIMTDAELEAALQEQIDGREDDEYHATGNW